jgi:hypothetical protein
MAFSDYASGFIDAAETDAELDLFVKIAILGWNVGVQPVEMREELIGGFIDRFRQASFVFHGKMRSIRHQVLRLAARKSRMCPDVDVVIRRLEFQDCREGLRLRVTATQARARPSE